MVEPTHFSSQLVARCLVANSANASASQWLLGTTALREENEIRVLEYNRETDSLLSVHAWSHPEEVWDIATSSATPSALLTVHNKGGKYGASLWRADTSGSSKALERQAALPHEGVVRRALWHQSDPGVVVTVEEGALHRWQLAGSQAQCAGTGKHADATQPLWTASLHPRQPHLAAVAAGSGIQVWDLNSMQSVGEAAGAHKMPVRDLDWAPQNEHRLVSGGGDCKLRFWDTRNLSRPECVLELGGHSHWVWRARFNPQHDQLLASASSDATVALWHTPLLARASSGGGGGGAAGGGRQGQKEADGRVHTYDEHEDSVYGLAWSAADPWLFASLSHDGRVVLQKVPKNIKYKILI